MLFGTYELTVMLANLASEEANEFVDPFIFIKLLVKKKILSLPSAITFTTPRFGNISFFLHT